MTTPSSASTRTRIVGSLRLVAIWAVTMATLTSLGVLASQLLS